MTRRKASMYSIASNHSRAIEHELQTLSESNRQGGIHGITYAVSDRKNNLEVGCAGSHSDTDKAVGALFRAAMTLVMAG